MRIPNRSLSFLIIALAAGTMACGGDDIDHKSAQQSISSNTNTLSMRVASSIAFLDESELFQDAFEFSDSACVVESSSGADFDTGECVREPVRLDEGEMQQSIDQLTQVLETRVFTSANIESESGSEITYLMRGNVVCAEEESVDQDCANTVDEAEIRLRVASPANDEITIDILVGPARTNPLDLELSPTLVAAQVDLRAVKNTIEHLALLDGENPELPEQMSGTIRLAIAAPTANRATATFSILEAINIADDEWRLTVDRSSPTTQITADAAEKSLETVSNLGTVEARFPSTEYSYDAVTGEESEITRRVDFTLGGLTGATVLSAGDDSLTLTELGLGDVTSRLSIEGREVLSVDLNADDGRTFNATISAANDSLEIAVAPVFDLLVDMNFVDAPEYFADIDDWMLDETLSILASGSNGARMVISDGEVEMLEGKLALTLGNAAISHQVDAGQCLLAEETQNASTSCTDAECSDGFVDESVNPFDELSVGACR